MGIYLSPKDAIVGKGYATINVTASFIVSVRQKQNSRTQKH